MPRILKRILLLEVLVVMVGCLILPLYETGVWRAGVIGLSILPLVLAFAFSRRLPFSDIVLRTYCATASIVGMILILLEALFSKYIVINPPNVLMVLETILLACLFVVAGSTSARAWFARRTRS